MKVPKSTVRITGVVIPLIGLAVLFNNCSKFETLEVQTQQSPLLNPKSTEFLTIEKYKYNNTEPTMISSVTTDRYGNYFYSMYVGTGYTQWVVRKSSDLGKTWTITDDFHNLADQFNYPTALATDQDGNVFTSGVVAYADGFHGYIRKSSDQGGSWSTVLDYLMAGSSSCKIYNVKSFGQGLVLSLGRCQVNGIIHWLIRKSTDGGMSWRNVDYPHSSLNYPSKVLQLAQLPNGELVAFGYLGSAESDYWIFRKSVDNGETWIDLAQYHTQSGFSDQVGGLMVTKKGALLASG